VAFKAPAPPRSHKPGHKCSSIMPKSQTAGPSADKLEGVNVPYPRPMTRQELAAFLGVSQRTIDSYIASRRIPYVKLGRLVRFRLPDVERALSRFTIEEVSL
jgi:excisionase family DNA binding protein